MTVERSSTYVAEFASRTQKLLDSHGPDAVVAGASVDFSSSTQIGVTTTPLGWLARRRLRSRTGLQLRFSGSSLVTQEPSPAQPIQIFDRWDPKAVGPKPPLYDVLAIITTYNELDVIGGLINYLHEQGVRCHVIDNWSTDGTFELVSQLTTTLPVTIERFPKEGPSEYFEWEPLLERIEEVAHSSDADWVIHHDADEIRQSSWAGVRLSDALWAIDTWGFNCVDHTVIEFRPIDNRWELSDNVLAAFEFCEFLPNGDRFLQLKAWKPQSQKVRITAHGGHAAEFEGRRVFPYKFITRHYSIRSQIHGQRKVLKERQGRWSPTERAKGWHIQYDAYDEQSSFLWDERDLFRFELLDEFFLIQRLSGVGLPGNPFVGEPSIGG